MAFPMERLRSGKMFKILKAYGIPSRQLSAIEAMDCNTKAKVVTNNGDTAEFRVR